MKEKFEIFMQRYSIKGCVMHGQCELRKRDGICYLFPISGPIKDSAEALVALFEDFNAVTGKTYREWIENCGGYEDKDMKDMYNEIKLYLKGFKDFVGKDKYDALFEEVYG